MLFKVINDLIEQGLANPVEVDVSAHRCPPQMEMANWLLKTYRFLICLNDGGCFEPKLASSLLEHPPDQLWIVAGDYLILKLGYNMRRV